MWCRRFESRRTYILCEVISQPAHMLRKNHKYVEKDTSRLSRFIADSLPSANKAGMRQRVKQTNTGPLSLCESNPPSGIAWG